MKKLLTAILAFSCAFGAWADDVSRLSGTDFSTYPVGVFSTDTDDSGLTESAQRYWFSGNKEDFDGEVVNVSSNEETGATVNYLEFESNITNPVYRTVNNSFGAVAPDATLGDNANQGFIAKKIGTGIFIDTTVQFTPYLVNENHPSPTKLTDKDKIIVWVKETESNHDGVPNTTNLIVTAGYIEADGSATAKDYVIDCDADALCKGQHRLTIKAFEDISANSTLTIAGFVVYINEEKVSYAGNQTAFNIDASILSLDTTPGLYYTEAKKSLFPSLMGNTAGGVDGGDEISAVGFAGMGQVGEVWFDDYSTAYPAFASDDINFEIRVGDGVTSYTYNGQTYSETKTFAVKPGTASIEVTGVMYDTAKGWVAKAGTWFAGTTKVNNAGSADGDSGTFSFANGSQFTLAGFKANFEVTGANGVTTAFQTLFGNTAESGALANAFGGTLKLTGDITITEGDGSILIGQGQTLVLDLNGHTIQGTSESDATIRNNGTLTINDSSDAQTGKILGPVVSGYPSYLAIKVYPTSSTIINAGIIETIDISTIESGLLQLNGGTFLDVGLTGSPSIDESEGALFYLNDYCDNSSVERTWDSIEKDVDDGDGGIIKVSYWYATVSEKGAVVPETPVAKIGETEYTSLADAIAAATDESTIQIIANIDTDSAFVIEKTVTIDLNGCTIAMTENDKIGDGVFCVKAGGVLTINDSVGTGVIDGVGGADYDMAIWADGGKVVINGGNFTNEGASSRDPNDNHFDLIYAKHGGIVEITGGTFKCQTPRWTLNSNNVEENAEGSFVVTGGKFYQYNPTDIDTDDQPVTNWCPAGYIATLGNDGYYTVERIPMVTVTLPDAPANTTLEAFVGEDEVEITDNVITVLAGSSVVLKLTADEGYEFSKDVTVYTTEAAVVNENADWSSIVLPPVTQIVTDPWAPAAENDAAAQAKVAAIFGADSPAATNITTYAAYTNLVAYIKTTPTPDSLTADQKTYIIESFKLGAKELFTAKPKIELTEAQPSTDPNAEAGDWVFEVKVTQGEADEALEVAKDKVKALVKIRSDLKNGQWAAPQAENIDADPVTGGNEITIKIKFGDAKSGFMMIAE